MDDNKLQQLLNEVTFIHRTGMLREMEKRQNGEYFNVFSTLGLTCKED